MSPVAAQPVATVRTGFAAQRRSRPLRLLIGGFVAAVILIVAVVAGRHAATDNALLTYQLTRWQFWVLETQFVLLLVLSGLNLPSFIGSLHLPRFAIVAGVTASLAALVLAAAVAPKTNRIFYDEHIYQGIAQNLADLHLAQTCNDGAVEYGRLQCSRGEYNKQPYGYPYLLSVLYRMFGVHESIAHWFNTICAALLVSVVFLTTCALFGDARAGVFAGVVAALTPQQIVWSHTAAAEPSAALTAALAVMTAVAFVRSRTVSRRLWMTVATVFAAQFRPESLLVVAVVVLVVALFAPEEIGRASLWWAALLGTALCATHILHLFAVRGEAWGSTGDRMALGFAWPNLKVNGMFFLDNVRFPVVYTALALWGVASRPTRGALASAAYFLVFWSTFLFFYAGSYDYGADVRFSLLTYPAAAMLAGWGASSLHQYAVRMGLEPRRVTVAMTAALGFQFLWFTPQVRAVGEEAWAARADVGFAHRAGRDLPANSIVLTQNPAVFLLRGINAAQISLATTEPGYVSSLLPARYAGGVFLHWNYWCNADDAAQRTLCATALGRNHAELFRQYRERDYQFAFYRLNASERQLILKIDEAR